MLLRTILGRVRLLPFPYRTNYNAFLLIFTPLALFLITSSMILYLRPEILLFGSSDQAFRINATEIFQLTVINPKGSSDCGLCFPPLPPPLRMMVKESPYHNWNLFNADYQEMIENFKIFVYPDVSMSDESSPFARIFRPHPDPLNPKIGNYYSEHAFKLALLNSSLVTQNPEEADFFFMPFSINAMRNHPLVHSGSSISTFVADYVMKISSEYPFWNVSGGADHFFVCCHSVGQEAASKHFGLHNNAIQVTCSSSYFQRLYAAHKDIAMPQVWPRPHEEVLNPPSARTKLVFFSGRVQNSVIRQELVTLWENDTSLSVFSGHSPFPYEEGFRRSKYCLHVKGYEVNTARVVDAIHYGCVPVMISNYYDLPFATILDWSKFSIIVSHADVALLKYILSSISEETYLKLYRNLCIVRNHFEWNSMPTSHDAFHMTAYQLWARRGIHRVVT